LPSPNLPLPTPETSATFEPRDPISSYDTSRPTRKHKVPARFALTAELLSGTTASSLFISESQKPEFSVKKGLAMANYSHAVGPAIDKEMKKMFITYKALKFVDKADIPTNAIYYRFFMFLKLKFLPDHSFERMAARLCAMEQNSSGATIDPATYAATGDHHLFLLAVTSVIADAIKHDYLPLVELRRYDVPGAFLQCKLTPENCPRPLYGRLPSDLPPPYNDKYVKFLRGIYGAKPSNRIFDLDHSATLIAIGYSAYLADPRKFLW
jgi:hypothetical protein